MQAFGESVALIRTLMTGYLIFLQGKFDWLTWLKPGLMAGMEVQNQSDDAEDVALSAARHLFRGDGYGCDGVSGHMAPN